MSEHNTKKSPVMEDTMSIVVFGASGDLATKKTFPAMFAIYCQNLFPKQTKIYGYARTEMDNEKFRERLSSKFDLIGTATQDRCEQFKSMSSYVSGGYDKDDKYKELTKALEAGEKEMGTKKGRVNRLFYLALPPSAFATVLGCIKRNCFISPDEGILRIIVEKPFGHDLESSQELQKSIAPLFSEHEVYRIDHYLGKEMVKNILIMRFANQFIGACWSSRHISSVQITFKEPFGTEGRGGYFDDVGIIRDVIQNHLIQVLSLIAMERPFSFNAEDVRNEKVKVLRAIKPITEKDTLLGQYVASEDGEKPGYLDDDSIKNRNSQTPTFAAVCVEVHNERWAGVPFILKAGKALNESKVEVRMQFKPVLQGIFQDIARNELVIRVQPKEAIYIKLNAKYPGHGNQTVVTDLDLSYNRRFSNLVIPPAYESLLLDCLNGDQSNFVRDDELEQAWKIVTPLLKLIEKGNIPVEKYPYGSRGPEGLNDFITKRGYEYSNPTSYSWISNL